MIALPVVFDHFNHDLLGVEPHPDLCLEEGHKPCQVILILSAVSIEVALDDSIATLTHSPLLTEHAY